MHSNFLFFIVMNLIFVKCFILLKYIYFQLQPKIYVFEIPSSDKKGMWLRITLLLWKQTSTKYFRLIQSMWLFCSQQQISLWYVFVCIHSKLSIQEILDCWCSFVFSRQDRIKQNTVFFHASSVFLCKRSKLFLLKYSLLWKEVPG